METKENSANCCPGLGGRRKKVFLIVGGLVLLAIIMLSIAVAGFNLKQARSGGNMMYGRDNGFGRGQMMNKEKGFYSTSVSSSGDNQFVLPQDALKSGELAIVVSDLAIARNSVAEIAVKNEGSIYATFIAYISNNVRNGSIVVQVPAEKFDATFGDLKKVGNQVVQEKTLQIAPNNFYPMPLNETEETVTEQPSAEASLPADDTTPVSETKPEIAIYPSSVQSQLNQDKGYVRVVFVDYGGAVNNGTMMQRQDVAGSILGVGNSTNRDMRNNVIVIVGMKLILLIALIGLLVVLFKKIINRIRRRKENKKVVHVVRQMPKARTRVVRIAKRK